MKDVKLLEDNAEIDKLNRSKGAILEESKTPLFNENGNGNNISTDDSNLIRYVSYKITSIYLINSTQIGVRLQCIIIIGMYFRHEMKNKIKQHARNDI